MTVVNRTTHEQEHYKSVEQKRALSRRSAYFAVSTIAVSTGRARSLRQGQGQGRQVFDIERKVSQVISGVDLRRSQASSQTEHFFLKRFPFPCEVITPSRAG